MREPTPQEIEQRRWNIKCWWFGCERDPQDYAPPEYVTCIRCGECISYGDLVGDTRHNRFKEGVISILRKIWPKRCTQCGRKWTACDESVDHIPF